MGDIQSIDVSLTSLDTKTGEVQATPTANTTLARLKDLLSLIVLAAGTNVVGKVRLVTALGDEITDDTADAIKTVLSAASVVIGKVRLVTATGDEITDDTLDAIKAALQAGSALIGKVGIDQTTPGTTNAVVEASAADIKTAVQLIDNFISGSRGLVTEDSALAIKTAVEAVNTALQAAGITQTQLAAIQTAVQVIDNFISGSKGLVTEDNSGSIKTAVEAINTALQTAGISQTQFAAMVTALQIIDNMISGNEAQVDIVSLPSVATATPTAVTVGNTSTAVLALNAARKFAIFVNDSSEAIYLALGATAVMNQGIRLNPYGGAYETFSYTGAVAAICASGSKVLCVTSG